MGLGIWASMSSCEGHGLGHGVSVLVWPEQVAKDWGLNGHLWSPGSGAGAAEAPGRCVCFLQLLGPQGFPGLWPHPSNLCSVSCGLSLCSPSPLCQISCCPPLTKTHMSCEGPTGTAPVCLDHTCGDPVPCQVTAVGPREEHTDPGGSIQPRLQLVL